MHTLIYLGTSCKDLKPYNETGSCSKIALDSPGGHLKQKDWQHGKLKSRRFPSHFDFLKCRLVMHVNILQFLCEYMRWGL